MSDRTCISENVFLLPLYIINYMDDCKIIWLKLLQSQISQYRLGFIMLTNDPQISVTIIFRFYFQSCHYGVTFMPAPELMKHLEYCWLSWHRAKRTWQSVFWLLSIRWEVTQSLCLHFIGQSKSHGQICCQ